MTEALDDDVTLDQITLDGRAMDARIASVVTGAQLDRTIEGASTVTLTLFDPERELLRSGIFDGVVDLEVDGYWFRLVKVGKSGDVLTLVFEDRAVAILRGYRSFRKARRDTFTRAEFAYVLVQEVPPAHRPGFVAPELHKVQPIAGQHKTKPRAKRREEKDRRRERGIPDDVRLPVGPNPAPNATRAQRDQMERALTVAQREDASERATLAMLVAGIGESTFRPVPNSQGSGYAGVFQADPDNVPMNDTEGQARCFLRGGKGFQQGGAMHLARENGSMSIGDIATRVEAGGKPPSFYDVFRPQAERILKAWGGAGDTVERTRIKPYEFTRGEPGKPEDTWTALGRLADEVGWRRFMVGNDVYFVAEADLYRSRPRMTLRERTAGVETIDFDFDYGKKVAEAAVTCRASRWIAPPGSVVTVEGCGHADGNYLVAGISRSFYSPATTITLRAPMRERPEPKPEVVTVRSKVGGTVDGNITTRGGARGIVEQAVAIAQDAGGEGVWVVSDYREGDTVDSGAPSDHSGNGPTRAARDIAVRGIDAITGPPSPKLDKAVVAIGKAFGRDYGNGKSGPFQNADNVHFHGYRVQIIWRTTAWGGHMGHIHIGARKE